MRPDLSPRTLLFLAAAIAAFALGRPAVAQASIAVCDGSAAMERGSMVCAVAGVNHQR